MNVQQVRLFSSLCRLKNHGENGEQFCLRPTPFVGGEKIASLGWRVPRNDPAMTPQSPKK